MLILLAPEKDIINEIEILTQLFQQGLSYYHLRKPAKNLEEHCAYLDQIAPKYHDRIMLHHCHELLEEYNLKGLHFTEQKRREWLSKDRQSFFDLQKKGKTISSSFHEIKEVLECTINFNYHFLSPIFSSISKKGYQGRYFNAHQIDKRIIGMGGIHAANVEEAIQLGFNGIGVLGGVWSAENSVESFNNIKQQYKKCLQKYAQLSASLKSFTN
ncbi:MULTISPECIES: thiamine phosphate synthase [unclassified Polaribacter]|uniref:thiamine phosphate synthase n=1 Tax=unclassified Polaribacter TaxID=196858 RepID=UPI0011BFACFA|nr:MULTISPECIES: thiamine phosphate synthase [unclassified Polaribacter]TXD52607.1 thiamine phosphate synthase [Polaribacter sp. IC063]TXD61831.1 thiamine phosphate synthase [Polaribacter sp. IC066]